MRSPTGVTFIAFGSPSIAYVVAQLVIPLISICAAYIVLLYDPQIKYSCVLSGSSIIIGFVIPKGPDPGGNGIKKIFVLMGDPLLVKKVKQHPSSKAATKA